MTAETATLEPTESAQATPTESFLSELNSDAASPADGSSPEPVAPTIVEPESQAPAAEPAATGAEILTQQPAAAPVPAEPKIKIRGKEYTAAELAGKPDLLQDLAQTYEQFPHLQQKYVQTLEQARQAGQPQQPGQQPPPGQAQQPQLTPQLLRASYEGQMTELAKTGFIEPDLVELYPDAVANLLLMRDLLMDTRTAVANMAAAQQNAERTTGAHAVTERIVSGFDSLATEGGVYEPLKQDDVRGNFYNYIVELNPPVDQLTPDFLRRQFVAFNHNVFVEAARRLESQTKAEKDAARRNSQGSGGGARPAREDAPKGLLDILNAPDD